MFGFVVVFVGDVPCVVWSGLIRFFWDGWDDIMVAPAAGRSGVALSLPLLCHPSSLSINTVQTSLIKIYILQKILSIKKLKLLNNNFLIIFQL